MKIKIERALTFAGTMGDLLNVFMPLSTCLKIDKWLKDVSGAIAVAKDESGINAKVEELNKKSIKDENEIKESKSLSQEEKTSAIQALQAQMRECGKEIDAEYQQLEIYVEELVFDYGKELFNVPAKVIILLSDMEFISLKE